MIAALFFSSALAVPPAPAPSPATANTNNTGPLTYDSFRLVHTRNVFDPDRRPIHPAGTSAPAATTRADYVALTGIADDGKESLAFFSGSRTEYNKVIPVNSKIAGSTITKITPANIEIQRGGRHLVVNVGQTVPLDDKSTPAAAPTEQPSAAVPAATLPPSGGSVSAGSPRTGSTAATPAPPGNLDEIRRRMMERHNQDQK